MNISFLNYHCIPLKTREGRRKGRSNEKTSNSVGFSDLENPLRSTLTDIEIISRNLSKPIICEERWWCNDDGENRSFMLLCATHEKTISPVSAPTINPTILHPFSPKLGNADHPILRPFSPSVDTHTHRLQPLFLCHGSSTLTTKVFTILGFSRSANRMESSIFSSDPFLFQKLAQWRSPSKSLRKRNFSSQTIK